VPTSAAPRPLEWPLLLAWLRDDGWITADDAERVRRASAGGSSSLHALVRLGGAGLLHATRATAACWTWRC
jgi:general secretion pathway protein E